MPKIIGTKKRFFLDQKGQTLIELIVAISIILVGVVSTLVLTMTTIRGGKASKMQVIAANLAQEGIEVVRQKRDSNWLKIESNALSYSQWDDGLKDGTDYTAIAQFSEGPPVEWTIDYENGGESIDECITNANCRIYFKNGIYAQFSTTPGEEWESTPYYRLIQTNELCKNDSGEEYIRTSGEACDTGEKIGIQVLSEVKWQEKEHWVSQVFEEHLYNWK